MLKVHTPCQHVVLCADPKEIVTRTLVAAHFHVKGKCSEISTLNPETLNPKPNGDSQDDGPYLQGTFWVPNVMSCVEPTCHLQESQYSGDPKYVKKGIQVLRNI